MAMIHCVKLGTEAEGLDFPPLPGELGQKVFQNISKKAWQMWISHQTILINEYRLNLMEEQAQKFLQEEMEKFLFGEESA